MSSSARLDAFTDAAFAFAVTLLVIGGARAPEDFNQLVAALGDLPAFAFGFAIIAMFWMAHVRWRSVRGEGGGMATFLTLVLIFLTLIYVQPLRGMASAIGLWMTGQGRAFEGNLAGLFGVYGTGFTLMALTLVALWSEALRDEQLTAGDRAAARGDRGIWTIHALTGLASVLLSATRWGMWAGMLYASLPLTIGWFAWRHDWGGERGAVDGEA